MKNTKLIQLKAAFLLMVFSLNMVVAFACSMGLDMGFNQSHHHEDNEEQVTAEHGHHHEHEAGVASHHKHEGAVASQHHENKAPEKDGCCNDKAIQFQQGDKSLAHAADVLIKAPVFIAFLSAFYGLEINPGKTVSVYFNIPHYYYPPPDIRIAIQSFQI